MATSQAGPRRADSESAGQGGNESGAARVLVTPANRVRPGIGCVRPQVEGGRRPAKAAVGDMVVVEADAIADGNDVLICDLRYRHDGDLQWSTVPMELPGDDR